MAKNKKIEEKSELVVFTVAYDAKKKAIAFAGSMPAAQAASLIQEVVRVEAREELRKEIEAEQKEPHGA